MNKELNIKIYEYVVTLNQKDGPDTRYCIGSTKSLNAVHEIIVAVINNVNKLYKKKLHEYIKKFESGSHMTHADYLNISPNESSRIITFDVGEIMIVPNINPDIRVNTLQSWIEMNTRHYSRIYVSAIDATHGKL